MTVTRGVLALFFATGCAATSAEPSDVPLSNPARSASPETPSAPAATPPATTQPATGDRAPDPNQPPTADHRFEDAKAWSKVFDDPARDGWQRPEALVGELRIAPDETVVDLGTGTGYFVGHLAHAVPHGRVIAVDVEPNLLAYVEKRVTAAKLTNVVTRLAEKHDPKLDERIDLVLVVDTYHHIGQRSDYFRRLATKLTDRGRVVIVDFRIGKLPVGPPDHHKIAPDVVESEMKLAGYARCASWDGLLYQYVLEFRTHCAASGAVH